MSDGYFSGADFDLDPSGNYETDRDMAMIDSSDTTRADSVLSGPMDLLRLLSWLPQLGTILWLRREARDKTFPRARMLPQGVLLLEHPALAALSDCVGVVACSAVTSHGPREWLAFADTHGVLLAKLYLLPDTDYLAWDGMLAACRVEKTPADHGKQRWQAHLAFMRGALSCLRTSWQAQIVRFPTLRLPCMHVLGLRAAEDASVLGRNIAAVIVHDERAEWCECDT